MRRRGFPVVFFPRTFGSFSVITASAMTDRRRFVATDDKNDDGERTKPAEMNKIDPAGLDASASGHEMNMREKI